VLVTASAIVLCGGRSSRMGRDKATLAFGHETLLARVVRTAQMVVDDVVVVGESDAAWPDGVRVVRDSVEGLGPLAGLVTGLSVAHGDRALLLACDMPLLVPAVLRRLVESIGEAEACVPLVDTAPMTTCAVYARGLLPRAEVQLASSTRSLRALLTSASVRWMAADELRDLDPELLSFWDCDTPERYRAALLKAGLGASLLE
jgi:molybdopterin-guanine dinucleotide biosynthesis protein A